MIQNNANELKNLKKKMLITQIIGSFGFVFLGLGLYGMFGADGDAFHPLLEDKGVIYGLLAVGGVIELWQLFVLIPLFKKQAQLTRESKNLQG